MDEPFANLDVGLRHDLRQEVFGLLRCTRIPVLLVTHDQEEALTVSDQLAVMRGGRIEQSGAPDKVYRNPTTRFVASFIGQASWVVGTRNEGGIVTELGRLKRSVITIENCVCDEVWVLLRPEDVALSNNGTGTPARVLSQSYHGTRRLHTLQLPSGTRIRASFNAEAKVRPGDMVPLRLVPKQVSLFAGPAEAGEVPNCCQTARAAQQQVNRVDSQILKKLV